jgi:8-oxo-dGTP diphosphatase
MKKVTAAILVENGRILIARRKAGDPLAHKWEFPGGKIEDGETPQECLEREMREEFQITVQVAECLGESVYHGQHGSIQLLAYRTYWKEGTLLPMVHDEIQWVAPEHLHEYDFAPADVPFVKKLATMEWQPSEKNMVRSLH